MPSISEIINIGGWAVAGSLAFAGIFNYQRQQRRHDDDALASNLIANLKTTVEVQEKELIALRGDKIEQGKEIAHLQGQIKVLTDIFQGRDPKTQAAIEKIPEILAIAQKSDKSLEALTVAMTDFMTVFKGALTGGVNAALRPA